MSTHRAILARLLTERGLSHAKIAKLMGWRSAATVGHKLRGERPWQEGELERMCELAGITLVHLAALSSDLHVSKHADTLEGARLLDAMTPEQRQQFIALMRLSVQPDP